MSSKTPPKKTDFKIIPGSGNVWIDLGFTEEEAFILEMKSDLCSALKEALEKYPTAKKASRATGISRPRISEIKNGSLGQFSIDRLLTYCFKLGLEANITITNGQEN